MPVTVKRIHDEPIILLTLEGVVTANALRDGYLHSIRMAQNSHVYRIIDMRDVQNHEDVIETIQAILQAITGVPLDPEMRVLFVGQPWMADGLMGMYAPFFDHVEEAVQATGENIRV